ncbi:MAG: GNAT family N-acetyltransferase [Jiangellaceae bacterium]
MSVQVVDAPERHRYEAVRDGAVLGFAAYQRTDELIVFTHTEVDPSLRHPEFVDLDYRRPASKVTD